MGPVESKLSPPSFKLGPSSFKLSPPSFKLSPPSFKPPSLQDSLSSLKSKSSQHSTLSSANVLYQHSSSPHPSIFSTLWRQNVSNPHDFIPLFADSVSTACCRTQEYLLFRDPENKFHASPDTLTQIFLMTYISQSVNLNMTDRLNCTAMTPEQRILLGADWVWAVLERPSKNPRIQIAVQVLHLPDREAEMEDLYPPEVCTESMQMARKESSHRTTCERMVDFCASIGKDCYALFLFFGKKSDRGNIYGVLSNNFEAAIGKCNQIDRDLIENFFKGSRYLHTPTGMLRAIVTKKEGDPLTLLIKFS